MANPVYYAYEAQIKSADMSEDMQQEAIEVATEAMEKFQIEKFDSRKGATWHCIVGRNFGSFVTHDGVDNDDDFPSLSISKRSLIQSSSSRVKQLKIPARPPRRQLRVVSLMGGVEWVGFLLSIPVLLRFLYHFETF
ncbi:dynein light chain [Uncinocarpus reesii 1704]|uniref:Dynein light chain n=1 Tax=Uncinocarpus reesii (strain UAMH 1704) TaxID=336963 RepID=C4JVP6_UNCRE|nr:dynein light chain [Uncinocarpus reesii 1704]EEP81773.1 dynein light chain [Uncinocarpus reesii 1704]